MLVIFMRKFISVTNFSVEFYLVGETILKVANDTAGL